jgi:uncharacterized protein (PEP-CTERM system associated)
LVAAVPAYGVLAFGAGPAAAQFQLQPSLGVAESFSDNVDQDPDGQETTAFITDVTPGATLRWTSRRVTTSLDLAMTASHQTDGDDEGVTLEPDVAGLGSAEILQENLFLDASASASSELLNTREQDTESNRSIVQNYSASPRLVGRFGNFADAEANYRFDQLIEDGGSGASDIGNSQTHTVGAALNSGPDFAKWSWSLNGQASKSKRDNDDDVSRRNATLDLEYAVDRSFSVLGSGGYQFFDDGDSTNDIDGPTWRAGFRWRPGPRTDLTATYGRSDGVNSFAANLQYQITPQTRLFASYDEVLETGDERLNADLASIGSDPDTGALLDTRTGLPFDASSSTTTVDSDTTRTKTFSTGLTGVRGRNTFGITGTVELTEDESGGGDDEDAYTVSLSWGRQLSPQSQIGTSASYVRNEFNIDGREDNEYTAGIVYTYSIYTNINVSGGYDFTRQDSTDSSEEFVENRVTLGVGVTF